MTFSQNAVEEFCLNKWVARRNFSLKWINIIKNQYFSWSKQIKEIQYFFFMYFLTGNIFFPPFPGNHQGFCSHYINRFISGSPFYTKSEFSLKHLPSPKQFWNWDRVTKFSEKSIATWRSFPLNYKTETECERGGGL